MAEINLNLKLQEANRDVNNLISSGATNNVKNSARDMNSLITSLSALLKVSNPTNEQLRQIAREFKELDNIIKTVADTIVKISPELTAKSKEIAKAQSALDKAREKRDKLLEKGDSTGKLRKKYIAQQIEGITYAEGTPHAGKQVTVDAFLKNAKTGNFSQYSDPAHAAGIASGLDATQKNLPKKFDEASDAIERCTQTLEKLKEEAKALSSGGDERIWSNADTRTTDVQTEIGRRISANKEKSIQASGGSETVDFNQKLNTQSGNFSKAFKQFSIYAIAIRGIRTAIRSAISTIKELDKSLTEQAMVTGKTREQTYALLGSYQKLAAQTGATTKEVAELATQFMRQGKTTQDALTLIEAAMDAAKVAGISATDSVNYLTTALNGFQMSANDAMKVSDKFAAIAANSATSYDEIATALSKVASQANLAGMSIDYTTALLAKGLETTREAPETMGTALKTVIARMREIKDYGETLGGDTDVNNVESQLAYVGIQLRDNNGELRSTEDVLDDLGKKWDTLNGNQQAAVAKALAGTRQQSRLIAMMTDYERVIELQEIAQRSQGATLAQMSTYLEGMSAALNKVSIAWEKIVTSITDSGALIQIITIASGFLNGIGDLLDNVVGMQMILTTILSITVMVVAKKMEQLAAQKMIEAAERESLKVKLKARQAELKLLILQKQHEISIKKQLIDQKKLDLARASDLETQTRLQKELVEENVALAALTTEEANFRAEEISNQTQLNSLQTTEVSQWSSIAGLTATTGGGIMSLITGSQNWLMILSLIGLALKALPPILKTIQLAQEKSNASGLRGAIVAMAKNAASTLGVPGLIMAGALLAVAGVAAIAGIVGAINSQQQSAADQVNSLSNEIYKLNEKASAIKQIASSYDNLNNAIIKTNASQKEMNELLDKGADALSEEEQKVYKALTTNKERIEYLKNIQKESEDAADIKRKEQLKLINSLSAGQKAKFLDPNTTNSEYLTAQSAIYAIANANLYKYIDELKEAEGYTTENAAATEKLVQSLLEELDVTTALQYANDPKKIKTLAQSIASLTMSITKDGKTINTGIAEILTSDDYSLLEKTNAFEMALSNLTTAETAAFKELYADIEILNQFDDTLLIWMDTMGITAKGLNAIGDAIQDLGYSTTEATEQIKLLFNAISEGADLSETIYDIFGALSDTEYAKILNAYSNAVGTGMLNMGQNINKLKNTVTTFYDTANQWNTMSDTDKTSFMQDYAELFAGEGGAALLKAFESGNYATIEAALKNSKLAEQLAQQLQDINTEIAIEEARSAEDRNEAYISYLKEQRNILSDYNNFYKASLETRLNQEQAYLDEYKSYLSDQKDALEKSLNERKEAYSKYFEAINQEADDEDFEEKENQLMENIAKLQASSNADAINKRVELEQQLADLEKERLKTLRERAQEKIVENIEDQIEEINEKFDELINSNQALLEALTADSQNPSAFLSNMIMNKANTEGLTTLGLQNYIQELQSKYSNLDGFGDLFGQLGIEESNGDIYLTINEQRVANLTDTDKSTVYQAIVAALTQIGLR